MKVVLAINPWYLIVTTSTYPYLNHLLLRYLASKLIGSRQLYSFPTSCRFLSFFLSRYPHYVAASRASLVAQHVTLHYESLRKFSLHCEALSPSSRVPCNFHSILPLHSVISSSFSPVARRPKKSEMFVCPFSHVSCLFAFSAFTSLTNFVRWRIPSTFGSMDPWFHNSQVIALRWSPPCRLLPRWFFTNPYGHHVSYHSIISIVSLRLRLSTLFVRCVREESLPTRFPFRSA